MQDVKARQGSVVYVLLVSFVAAVGGFLFGFDTAVIAGANPFLTEHFDLSSAMLGWVVSSVLVGCVFGAAFAGSISDKFGRKKVLIVCAGLFAISALFSALATSVSQLVWARFIGGLGVGAASMLSPMYIAEISPAKIRGRLVSLNQLTIVIGILVAYVADYIFKDIPETNWRWMFGSEAVPAVLFLFLLLFVPESPRWLTKRGRKELALDILAKVGGRSHAEKELSEIEAAIKEEESNVGQLFHSGFRMALFIGIFLAIAQQVTGINMVMYYAPRIFEAGGAGIDSSLAQTVIIGAVNLTFTFVAIWIVDRFGRKVLLLAGSLGMFVTLLVLSGVFYFKVSQGPWILIAILAYIGCFASSLGPVVWVVISEIFPNRVRGRAMSIATLCLWIGCFAVAQVFPILLEKLGGAGTFAIFALMCAITFGFVYIKVPETMGKTLEEIEKQWLN